MRKGLYAQIVNNLKGLSFSHSFSASENVFDFRHVKIQCFFVHRFHKYNRSIRNTVFNTLCFMAQAAIGPKSIIVGRNAHPIKEPAY